MIVIVRLAYCLKYRIPAFITFYKNTDGERAAKEKYDDYPPQRKYDEGAKYLQNYLSSQLLNHVTGEYQTEVEEAQSDILHQMIEYLFETPVVRGSTPIVLRRTCRRFRTPMLTTRREEFIDHLVDVINGRSEPKSEFAVTGFDPAEMVSWSVAIIKGNH